MIHFEAFHGSHANGQRACDQATAKANAWIHKHRFDAKVLSASTSQNGYVYDNEPGVEYILTILAEVSGAFVFEPTEEAENDYQ